MRLHDPVDRAAPTRHRPEVQGLRALAVLLVVIYHVWVGRVSGGVDVFFVLTGFLLTGGLVRAAERGQVSVRARWSRTLTRLVPAAAVVLVAVAVAGALALPEGQWAQTARELAAAALFVENWQLAADAVDYAARSNATSPVQHFWSLAIQGQVFLVWPPVVAAIAVSCAGRPGLIRPRTTAVLVAVFAASLVCSVQLTATDQPLAYFHTLTRLWEFVLGGLLALHGDRLVPGRRSRIALGWAGVAGLVACGALVPVAALFPGWIALWPTGCAAAVLVAGHTGEPWAADRLLAARIAGRLGDLSYPLYLWHWPLLIGYLAVTGRASPGPVAGTGIVLASLALAAATHAGVERPALARFATVRGGLRVGVAGTVAVLLAAAVWQVGAIVRSAPDGQPGDARHPGALALLEPETASDPSAGLLPAPAVAVEDWHRIERWDCTPMRGFDQDVCAQPGEADRDATKRIVVVGDSHAQQLSAALVPLAAEHGWQLIELVRGACPYSTASETVPDDADCLAWLAAASDMIDDLRPDAVVTLASRDVRPGLTEHTPPGFVEQWRRLGEAGIPVLAIRDNPRFTASMPDCVEREGRDPQVCGADRADVYAASPPWTALPDVPPTVTFVDIADAVCTADRCPAVIGNELVYLDDNHLTATYAQSMAPLLRGQVLEGLGRGPEPPASEYRG